MIGYDFSGHSFFWCYLVAVICSQILLKCIDWLLLVIFGRNIKLINDPSHEWACTKLGRSVPASMSVLFIIIKCEIMLVATSEGIYMIFDYIIAIFTERNTCVLIEWIMGRAFFFHE